MYYAATRANIAFGSKTSIGLKLVPFFADVFVGESFAWQGSRQNTMLRLEQAFEHLAAEGAFLE